MASLISFNLKDIIDNKLTIEQMETLLEHKTANKCLNRVANEDIMLNKDKQKIFATMPQY